ncbi:MAG: NADH-quinone oxidoreductase subunit F, partial [Chloroflexi bacterium]|nr:NADH-quinone oxidoreductase subunit F [Chloroflexota bacterium]
MKTLIRVGMATCGLAAGARAVYDALTAEIASREFPVQLLRTGCLGACHREVLVEVADEAGSTLYGPITPSRVGSILDRHLSSSHPPVPVEWVVSRRDDRSDYPFLAAQTKVTSRNCGVIDPLSLDDYLATGGYAALQAALRLRPQEIVELVKQSNLRGRGGAGFPTGLKWELTRREARQPRYLICNADEGDPGAFMDRSLIEGDPHALLEGMVIAGYATGASTGYIYIRAEYPLAVKHLRIAIEQARAAGFLGKSILGRDFGFDILIREGAGAFVCGEETALIHSIEGGRGTPRMRPPYPAQSGLWGQPTTINNVETLASIPAITREGPEAFARLGTARSGGTKL